MYFDIKLLKMIKIECSSKIKKIKKFHTKRWKKSKLVTVVANAVMIIPCDTKMK